MITSPWNSTVLRQYKTGGIVSELAVAKAMGGLVADGASVVLVTPLADKVPAFMLPITSEEYSSRKLNENGVVFMDGRSFMRREQRSASGFIVANQTQADFTVRLGELTALWLKEPSLRDDFLRVGDLAPQTYIAWLSGLISNKMGVDLDVSREIQIITGLFYIHHFYSADIALSERGKETSIKLLQRWTRAPIQLIVSIVEDAQYMGLLNDYVEQLHIHFSGNTRISQVNVGFIVMALGRSWFGFGAQEIAGCAIEYPPAFLALVEAAANAKVWRKTHLGTLVQRLGATGKTLEEFIRSMEMLAGKIRPMSVSLEGFVPSFESEEEMDEGEEEMEDEDMDEGEESMESLSSVSAATQKEIDSAQKALGLKFSPDFTAYLKKYGTLTIGAEEIMGLGSKAGHRDVVQATLDIRDWVKTKDFYVVQNLGIDSVFICSDSKDNLYQVTPNSEKALGTTFKKFLANLFKENGDVSLESFKEAEWKHGWTAKTSISGWGEGTVVVKITAQATKDETVTREQEKASVDFKSKSASILKSAIPKMIGYIKDHHEKSYNTTQLFKEVRPTSVIFKRDGTWGILFDMDIDTKSDMAVYEKDGSVVIGEQDDFL